MKIKNRNGIALITAILVSAVLLILILACVSRLMVEYRLTSKSYKAAAAASLAEAGVERGINELSYTKAWTGWTTTVDTTTGSTIKSISVSSFQAKTGTTSYVTVGDYDSIVTFPVSGNITVKGIGYVPNKTSPEERRSVTVAMKASLFSTGIFSTTDVSLSGKGLYTDCYNSSVGDYSPSTATAKGDIASNGRITVSGQNVTVSGNATPGPGNTVTITGQNSLVTGSTLPSTSSTVLQPITKMTAASTTNNNDRILAAYFNPAGTKNLNLSGGVTLSLSAGTYYFTSLTMSNSNITVTSSPVNIYVNPESGTSGGNGNINLGDTVGFNASSISYPKPTDLFIYSNGSQINFSGEGISFYSGVYAPNATITIGGKNISIYGSMASMGFNFPAASPPESKNILFHRDLALGNVDTAEGSYKVMGWQDK